MNTASNPKNVHKPLGAYSHTIKIPAGSDWVVLSGQVGVDARGRLAAGIRKQAELTFKNIYDAETWGYLPWVERSSGKTILVESDNMPDLNRFIAALYGVNRRR